MEVLGLSQVLMDGTWAEMVGGTKKQKKRGKSR